MIASVQSVPDFFPHRYLLVRTMPFLFDGGNGVNFPPNCEGCGFMPS